MRRHSSRTVIGLVVAVVSVVAPTSIGSDADAQAGATDARDPSVSSDGRWVVFVADVDGRRSVFRSDRLSGATRELSAVPDGVRSGDTINARLSADGCVVAATTEVAFDLFRDDDRRERWDVYRLVVPECGGRPGAWELISADPRTGIALDGVDIVSAPSITATGAAIAYTHDAGRSSDGLTTISVVDVTVPPGEQGRVTEVAGFPVEEPNRAFEYGGAREPAISDNGRHLAFVADFTASSPLPGWGDGPELGGPATAQVFVWDRFASDQRRSVHLMSGRRGEASGRGGTQPTISDDGRVVVFVSDDRTLVTATVDSCLPDCPQQIFRFDRDVDSNGIFDEPPVADPLTIVSAIPTEFGLPVAGNGSSWAPTVSFDGSQVAFVTDATNLMPSRRGGGGDTTHGDLLVAEHGLGTLRRVLDSSSLTGVPGAHGRPAMSKTGDVVVFETAAGPALRGVERIANAGGTSIAAVSTRPELSLAELDFGTVLVGFESTELYATVRNAGPGAFDPVDVSVTSRFRVTGGSCSRGVVVAAGESCSVRMTFFPSTRGTVTGRLTVRGGGPSAPVVTTTVRGAGGEPTLLASPGGADFPDTVVGRTAGRVAVDVANIGYVPIDVESVSVAGADPDDFGVVDESCTGRALNPDASCVVVVEFVASRAGHRSASVVVTAGGAVDPAAAGSYTTAVLGGFARLAPVVTAGDDSDVRAAGRPGGDIVVSGSGFPPSTPMVVGFDDGGPSFGSVVTDESGEFRDVVRLPVRLRAGERRLVVAADGGIVAVTPIGVVGPRRRTIPGFPGYGFR